MTEMNSPGASRRKLSDILSSATDSLRAAWNTTKAATDFVALPEGTYVARIVAGELSTAKTGTPAYKLTFKVIEGEHAGRQIWHDIWLTPAALPMAKRDLAKLGVTSLEQLEQPLPPGIRCKVKLALRKNDGDVEYNQVRTFEALGIDSMDDDDFGPAAVSTTPSSPPSPTPAATEALMSLESAVRPQAEGR